MGRTVDDDTVRALAARVPLVLLAREPVGRAPDGAQREPRAGAPARRAPDRGPRAHASLLHRRPRLLAGRRRPLAGVPGRAPRPGSAGAARRLRGPVRRERGPRGGGRRLGPRTRRPRWCAPRTRSPSAPMRPSRNGACAPGTDIAVTGWDDIQLARFVTPALTTVRQPMDRLGRTAAELLLQRVGGVPAESQTLPSELVIRASCGCEPRTQGRQSNDPYDDRGAHAALALPSPPAGAARAHLSRSRPARPAARSTSGPGATRARSSAR